MKWTRVIPEKPTSALAGDEDTEGGAARVRLLVASHATEPVHVWSALFYDLGSQPLGLAVVASGRCEQGEDTTCRAAESWLEENRGRVRELYAQALVQQADWRQRVLASCSEVAA